MARTLNGYVVMWSRPSGKSGVHSRIYYDEAEAVAEVRRWQVDIDENPELYYVGERIFLAYVAVRPMPKGGDD